MKETFTLGCITFIIIGLLVLFGVAMGLLNFESYKFFTPKYEAVRRQTVEQSKSYIDGKQQQFIKYKIEYLRETDQATKKAIGNMIKQSMIGVDTSNWNYDDTAFLNSL